MISPKAKIGANNQFGHGVVIDDDVQIGDGNRIADYTVITGKTRIGSDNYIGDHVSIGRLPTNTRLKYEFDPDVSAGGTDRFGSVIIGNSNVIREFTNVGLPTLEATSIADDCYIMPHCHIAHDVVMEDGVILSNHCSPGGFTRLLTRANLGKGVQVHQRTVVGQYSMVGAGAIVIRNVLPGATVVGNPARFLGPNRVGLERNGFTEEDIASVGHILAGTPAAAADLEAITDRVQVLLSDFGDALSFARDSRTVPDIDLASVGLEG